MYIIFAKIHIYVILSKFLKAYFDITVIFKQICASIFSYFAITIMF